jgi:hypothetical protein
MLPDTLMTGTSQMRPLVLNARSGVCPTCLGHFNKRRGWQRYCNDPAKPRGECKRKWEQLTRGISADIAAKIEQFYLGAEQKTE